jgi:hypothetical protein
MKYFKKMIWVKKVTKLSDANEDENAGSPTWKYQLEKGEV